NQFIVKILKNIGKYSKFTMISEAEFEFFKQIKPIIEKRFHSKVEIILEKDSKEIKAAQALPGKPAIIIS
ncbi:MAG: hypothetical protein ACFFBK_14080, partial [Promethearchaeota archaeon]